MWPMLRSDDLPQSPIPPQSENRYREGRSVNPETQPPDPMPDGVGERDSRVASMRRRITISVGGALVGGARLGYVVAWRGGQFSTALRTAPIPLLALSVRLQIGALLARTEAWTICVQAAG